MSRLARRNQSVTNHGSVDHVTRGKYNAIQAILNQSRKVFVSVTDAPYNVQVNNSNTDAATSNTAAINLALSVGDTIIFPAGVIWINGVINLPSGRQLLGTGTSLIRVKDSHIGYIAYGNNVTEITMLGIKIQGNGLSGFSGVFFLNSTELDVEHCIIKKTGGIGLQFQGCSRVRTGINVLNENYFYGMEFRDCNDFRSIGDTASGNGNTGVASNAFGRGAMTWRCFNGVVDGMTAFNNTEYGWRCYSEAADPTTTYDITVRGLRAKDNVRADIVTYDEGGATSLVTDITYDDIKVRRTTIPTLGVSFLCHGDRNSYNDAHVHYSDGLGGIGNFAAFSFYRANKDTITNSSSHNVAVPLSSTTGVGLCTKIEVDKFNGENCTNAFTVVTQDLRITDSEFIHGGAGSDTGINNSATATGKNYYDDVRLFGFNIGIRIGDESVAIHKLKTSGGAIGLQKDGSSIANLEISDNDIHSANRNHLYALRRIPNSMAWSTDFALPTGDNYPLDARYVLRGAVVGSPYEYVKTGAAIGDFTSVGNL